VASLGGSESAARGFKIPAAAVTTDVAEARYNSAHDDEEEDEEAEALRGKLGEAAANAGEAVQSASAAVARFSARAAESMGGLFKGAGRKVLEMSKRSEAAPVRRTTAPAPNGSRAAEGQRLRPQSQPAISDEAKPSSLKQLPRKKLMLGAGGAVLLASLTAMAMHHSTPSAPPGAQAALTPAVATVAPPSTGAPLSATPAPTDLAPSAAASANVPLFGPTPMATMEPAPLAPPPGSPASVEAQEKADAKSNPSAAPLAAAAPDEGFSDESSDGDAEKSDAKASKGDAKEEKSTKTDSTPWGHGKLHSPTIYRLRLDGPGGKLQGALLPTGFTVLIPGHKVMEQGSTIAKRDTRIASVHTSNRTQGAEVAFRFRDSVPAYRVRLRRDYVEILIGDGETKAKAAKAAPAVKSDAKVASHGKAHKG